MPSLRCARMRFDEIGYWSELKLEIVRDYAAVYSTILARQQGLYHVYIDGFAGAGLHVSRTTGGFVPGSPLNALSVQPPFREFFLVDLNGDKVEHLRLLVGDRRDVHLLRGTATRSSLSGCSRRYGGRISGEGYVSSIRTGSTCAGR